MKETTQHKDDTSFHCKGDQCRRVPASRAQSVSARGRSRTPHTGWSWWWGRGGKHADCAIATAASTETYQALISAIVCDIDAPDSATLRITTNCYVSVVRGSIQARTRRYITIRSSRNSRIFRESDATQKSTSAFAFKRCHDSSPHLHSPS